MTNNSRRIYIVAAEQISCQAPLCTEWFDNPQQHAEQYVRSNDTNFKTYFPPLVARKMGRLLKRAVVTSLEAMKQAGDDMPDAVITGTGLGCVENTEAFLSALTNQGEELLTPTHFMQSTHNTIGSLIAIHTHNHGYNSTYSHKGISFESALFDAVVQLRLGRIQSALVGAHDEMTPLYYSMLQKIGYVGQPGQVQCSESSVAMYMGLKGDNAMCELVDTRIINHPDNGQLLEQLQQTDWDVVMLGLNGNPTNDEPYRNILNLLNDVSIPVAQYKNLFGECFSASALGLYALAHCMQRGVVPAHLSLLGKPIEGVRNALFINHSDGNNFTFTRLRRADAE